MGTLRQTLVKCIACLLVAAALVACSGSGGATGATDQSDGGRNSTSKTFGNKLLLGTPRVELSYTPDASIKRPQPPRAGSRAADFTLLDIEGHEVSLSDMRGRAVLISFWATWCAPCRIELPHIAKAYEQHRDEGFEVLAVNVREDPERVRRFAKELGLTFTVLLDARGQVAKRYFVRGIPTNVFVDKEGIVRAVHVGAMTESQLRQYVLDLID